MDPVNTRGRSMRYYPGPIKSQKVHHISKVTDDERTDAVELSWFRVLKIVKSKRKTHFCCLQLLFLK